MTTPTTILTINTPRIIYETIDNETVVIDTETGIYFNISGSGPLIFHMLESGATVEALVKATATAYAVDAVMVGPAVKAFLSDLLAEAIVREEDAVADHAPHTQVSGPLNAPFSPPVLHKFTDMEALLLVDPIHEVEDRGWPYQR